MKNTLHVERNEMAKFFLLCGLAHCFVVADGEKSKPEARMLHGEGASERCSHPGNGEWRLIKGSFVIPEGADPDSFQLNLYRKGDGAGQVLVDDVSATVDVK